MGTSDPGMLADKLFVPELFSSTLISEKIVHVPDVEELPTGRRWPTAICGFDPSNHERPKPWARRHRPDDEALRDGSLRLPTPAGRPNREIHPPDPPGLDNRSAVNLHAALGQLPETSTVA